MLMRHFFLALVLIGISHGSVSAQAEGRKLALLVGVQKYDSPDLGELKYAENDVVVLGNLLKESGYQVVVMSDSEGKKDSTRVPTFANITKQMDAMVKGGKRADTMLVALSGHGVQFQGDTENYFCPSDAQPNKEIARREKLLAMTEITRAMSDGGIGVKLVLVDACRNDPTIARGIDSNSIRPPKGGGIMFSCSREQRAFESAKHKHGIFFHFVVKGLQGEANNGRGEITWNSLVEYVSSQVPDEVLKEIGGGARQEPNSLTDISGRSPSLVRVGNAPVDTVMTSPAEALAFYRKGFSLIETVDVNSMYDAFAKAASMEPRNADFVAFRGYAHCRKGEYDQGDKDADEALRFNPRCQWAWNVKGIAAANREKFDDSIQHYLKAIEIDPSVHYFHCNLGMTRLQAGDPNRALKHLDKAVDLDPTSKFCFYFRSVVQYRRGQLADSLKDMNKAITLDPKNGVFYRDRAGIFVQLRQFDRVAEDIEAAMKNGCNDAQTFLYRGNGRHGLKQFDLALADYNQAIKMNAKLMDAWKYRGMLQALRKEYYKSVADFDEAIKLNDNDAESFGERGAAHFFLKQHDKAQADFNKAIELAPRNPVYYQARALVLAAVGHMNEAQRDLAKAQQLLGK